MNKSMRVYYVTSLDENCRQEVIVDPRQVKKLRRAALNPPVKKEAEIVQLPLSRPRPEPEPEPEALVLQQEQPQEKLQEQPQPQPWRALNSVVAHIWFVLRWMAVAIALVWGIEWVF